MKKLRNDRGETLVEVLFSVLIATLSVTLLFSCVVASSKLDRGAEGMDEQHYNALSEADAQPTPSAGASPLPSANVTIARVPASSEPGVPPEPDASPEPTPSAELSVTIYGGEGMYSYRRKP